MGFNTTVVILNDALGRIQTDPTFGRRIADAIGGLGHGGGPIALGMYDAARVVETHHADNTAVVAVGGNHATVLGTLFRTDHHTEAGKLAILQAMAAELGYKLIRKPKKRKKSAAKAKGAKTRKT